MNIFQENRIGVVGTITFHGIFLILLIWSSVESPDPLFKEAGSEGIVVNFGDSETGYGIEEPAPLANVEADAQTDAVVEQTPSIVGQTQPVEDAMITQNFDDDATAMTQATDRKVIDKQPETDKPQIVENKTNTDELKRIETERLKREAEQKRITDINNKIKGNLSGTNQNGGNSQGIAGGEGNQGKPDGQIGVNNYVGGGKGNGTGTGTGSGNGPGAGSGVDYSLAGRNPMQLPKPSKGIQASGTVVVEIIVNKDGEVISAYPGVKGSTTMDSRLLDAAEKAALKAKFNVDDNAPERQKGTIKYIFELQ